MKTDIDSLFKPKDQHKATELKAIVDTVTKAFSDVEMIILFGSYAAGKWVEDIQHIDGNEFGYKSDFDLLIILQSNNKANNSSYTASIETAIKSLNLTTPLGAIYHGIDFVNKQINEGSYYFREIIEQGYMLYNSNRHTLAAIKPLNILELKEKAERDFAYWTKKADQALRKHELCVEHDFLEEAAFELHQATERYYSAVQLVFTGYKPKTHDIADLEGYVNKLDQRFAVVFLHATQQQEDYFQLLKRAYVDARYNINYQISKEELNYIYNRVLILQKLTKEICQARIIEIAQKA